MVVFDGLFSESRQRYNSFRFVYTAIALFAILIPPSSGFAWDEAIEESPRSSLADVLAEVDASAVNSVEEAQFIVLVFLNVDCPIANRYAPELRHLAEDYTPMEIAFLRVYSDAYLTNDDLAVHAAEYDLPWRGVLDGDFVLAKRAGARVTPEVAVFDVHGALHYRGRIDDQFADLGVRRKEAQQRDLREALDALLAGNAPSKKRTKAFGCYIPYPRSKTSATTE